MSLVAGPLDDTMIRFIIESMSAQDTWMIYLYPNALTGSMIATIIDLEHASAFWEDLFLHEAITVLFGPRSLGPSLPTKAGMNFLARHKDMR